MTKVIPIIVFRTPNFTATQAYLPLVNVTGPVFGPAINVTATLSALDESLKVDAERTSAQPKLLGSMWIRLLRVPAPWVLLLNLREVFRFRYRYLPGP